MEKNNQSVKADAGKPQLTLVPRRIIWEAEELCKRVGVDYYIKDSLRAEMEK